MTWHQWFVAGFLIAASFFETRLIIKRIRESGYRPSAVATAVAINLSYDGGFWK